MSYYTYLTIKNSLDKNFYDFLNQWNDFWYNIQHKDYHQNHQHTIYQYIYKEPILYSFIENRILTPIDIEHVQGLNYKLKIFDIYSLSTIQTFLQFFHPNGLLKKILQIKNLPILNCDGIISIYPTENDYFLIKDNNLYIASMNEDGYFCGKEHLLNHWIQKYQKEVEFILYKNKLDSLLD
jgi:hypothetical protein